ncbi:MAG: hypothetical protein IMZ46_02405 [Acidobacteria bacterium]|nr:hypothetical protein [Acidobacteriota bacterium]
MPRDYNTVYLIGTKVVDGDSWNVDGKPFSSKDDADNEAEARTVKSGIEHYVFKAVTYYTQDEITASRSYFV